MKSRQLFILWEMGSFPSTKTEGKPSNRNSVDFQIQVLFKLLRLTPLLLLLGLEKCFSSPTAGYQKYIKNRGKDDSKAQF